MINNPQGRQQFVVQSYSKTEMATFYRVSVKTFMEWIDCDPIISKLRQTGYEPTQKVLKPAQVKIIVGHLGEP